MVTQIMRGTGSGMSMGRVQIGKESCLKLRAAHERGGATLIKNGLLGKGRISEKKPGRAEGGILGKRRSASGDYVVQSGYHWWGGGGIGRSVPID